MVKEILQKRKPAFQCPLDPAHIRVYGHLTPIIQSKHFTESRLNNLHDFMIFKNSLSFHTHTNIKYFLSVWLPAWMCILHNVTEDWYGSPRPCYVSDFVSENFFFQQRSRNGKKTLHEINVETTTRIMAD